jgi:chemotaxis protein CheD
MMPATMVQCGVERKDVGMGQIVVAQAPVRIATVLGSCVGVSLYCPRLRLGALGHVVLPRSNGVVTNPGKFADTAVPHMLQLLIERGAKRAGLIAKIAGGACMFAATGPMQIGDGNIKAVLEALRLIGLRAEEKDVGGQSGRRMFLHCDTGQVTIESVGCPPRVF